ncbi:MAG: phage virion morphogenesis protein [bacterium]
MEIRVSIQDMVTPKLKEIMQAMKDFRKPLALCREYMLGSIAETFRVGGRPEKWAPLKPQSILARIYRHHRRPLREDYETEEKYQKALKRVKRARGKAREKMKEMAGEVSILIDTGTLMRSVTERSAQGAIRRLTNTELIIGTNIKYAPYHQFGTKHIPKQPFLQILPEDEKAIVQIFSDWLEKEVER